MNLSDLEAFAAVAQARGFRGAAYVRGASASSLSDAVRRLEAALGTRLLHRTTRSVTPTDAGARLLERITPALEELRDAIEGVGASGAPAGTLRLDVPTIVARAILPPIAVRFLAAHPQIRLEVIADDQFIDVLGAGFDAGVRYEERLQQDMIAVPLGPTHQRFLAAGTPAYLDRRGRPQHPRDLLAHDRIGHRFVSGRVAPWELERDGEVIKVPPDGPLIASSIDMELAAALAGLGLIFSFEEALSPAIADGRLEVVMEHWCAWFTGPRLYYADRRHLPAPLRAFVNFLKDDRPVGAD